MLYNERGFRKTGDYQVSFGEKNWLHYYSTGRDTKVGYFHVGRGKKGTRGRPAMFGFPIGIGEELVLPSVLQAGCEPKNSSQKKRERESHESGVDHRMLLQGVQVQKGGV